MKFPCNKPDERTMMIEEAAALRILAQTLRAKSMALRKRNIVVLRDAEAAVRRSVQVSLYAFGAGTNPEFETHVWRLRVTPHWNKQA